MCRLPIDIKRESAVVVLLDGDVQHADAAIDLLLFGPPSVWMLWVNRLSAWSLWMQIRVLSALRSQNRIASAVEKEESALVSKSSMYMSLRGLEVDLPIPNPRG